MTIRKTLAITFVGLLAMMMFACNDTTTDVPTTQAPTTTASVTTTVSGATTATGATTAPGTTAATTASGTTGSEPVSLVGEYEIDITNLGMPLVFFLKIEANNTFWLAADRTYAVDKGHGQIASSGETYMFIYSDGTPTNPKTTTFTIENSNLHFSTPLYYGASTLQPSKVDDEDPEVIYYLLGKTLLYEDHFGEYAGGHEVTAMSSTIAYEYSLILRSGTEFAFISTYEMGGETYDYEESGFYRIDGTVLSLYPDQQDEVIGTITAAGEITIGIKPSEMASRSSQTLNLAITAACASTYTGYKKVASGEFQYETTATLVLDKFGGYVYTAVDVQSGTVEETGSFTQAGSTLTFTPSSGGDSYTGTLASYQVTAPFPVSTTSNERVSLKHYCQTVQGTFTATGTDAEENTFTATLNLYPDGTFDLVMVDADEVEVVSDYGTFVVFGSMMNLIGDKITTTIVSARGININIEIAPEVTVGFLLKK